MPSSIAADPANNSFKPTPLRSGKTVAERACHCFASTKLRGLTQALGRIEVNSKLSKRLRIALLLAASFVPLVVALGGIVTGRVDGLMRGGNDLVSYDQSPLMFIFLCLLYLGLALAFAALAFREIVRKAAA